MIESRLLKQRINTLREVLAAEDSTYLYTVENFHNSNNTVRYLNAMYPGFVRSVQSSSNVISWGRGLFLRHQVGRLYTLFPNAISFEPGLSIWYSTYHVFTKQNGIMVYCTWRPAADFAMDFEILALLVRP